MQPRQPSPLISFQMNNKRKRLPIVPNVQDNDHLKIQVPNSQVFAQRTQNFKWDSRIQEESNTFKNNMTDNPDLLATKFYIGDAKERLVELKDALATIVNEDDFLFGINPVCDLDSLPMHQIQESKQLNIGSLQLNDIQDFIDNSDPVLIEEGKAVNELEVYTITFEQCLQLLSQFQGSEKIVQMLNKIKNYYINKATRKGQRLQALELATTALDKKIILTEQDLMQTREFLQQKIDELSKQSIQYKKLELEADDLKITNNRLTLENESLLNQQQRLLYENNVLSSNNLQLQADIDNLNQRVKHLTSVSQRLRQVSDQSIERLHISEKKLQSEYNHKTITENKLKAFQNQVKIQDQQIIKLTNDIEQLKDKFEQQKQQFLQKLYKYGEAPDQYGSENQLNTNVKDAIQTIVQLTSSDMISRMSQFNINTQGLYSLRQILQGLNQKANIDTILQSFTRDLIQSKEIYSKDIQVNTIVQQKSSRINKQPSSLQLNLNQNIYDSQKKKSNARQLTARNLARVSQSSTKSKTQLLIDDDDNNIFNHSKSSYHSSIDEELEFNQFQLDEESSEESQDINIDQKQHTNILSKEQIKQKALLQKQQLEQQEAQTLKDLELKAQKQLKQEENIRNKHQNTQKLTETTNNAVKKDVNQKILDVTNTFHNKHTLQTTIQNINTLSKENLTPFKQDNILITEKQVISQKQKQTGVQLISVAIQVDNQQENVKYLKQKINELIRKCQDAGILKHTLQAFKTEDGDEEWDLSRFEINTPVRLDQDQVTVAITSTQQLRKQKQVQLNPDELLTQQDNMNLNDNEQSSSIEGLPSFQHDDNIDQRLLKYVKETVEDKEMQTILDSIEVYIQTDQLVEEFLNFDWDNKQEEAQDIRNFKVSNQLSIITNDSVQSIPIYKPQEVTIFNQKIVEVAQLSAFQDIAKLIQQKTAKKQNSTSQTQEENKSLVLQQKEFQDENEFQEIKPLEQQQDIPTFTEYFKKQEISLNENIPNIYNKIKNIPNKNNELLQQFQNTSKQSYFQLGFDNDAEDKDKQILNKQQQSRGGQVSKLKAATNSYIPLSSKHVKQTNDVLVKQQYDIPTYNDFVQLIADQGKVQLLNKVIKPSLIEIHPRFGKFAKNQLDLTKQQPIDLFRIPHIVDKLYLKFYPEKLDTKLQLYPCVLKKMDIGQVFLQNSQLQDNTKNYFQDLLNKTHLQLRGKQLKTTIEPDFGPILFPSLGQPIKYLRYSALSSTKVLPGIISLLEDISVKPINVISVNKQTYLEIPLENVVLKPLPQIIKLIRQILTDRQKSTVSIIVEQATKPTNTSETTSRKRFDVISGQLSRQHAESLAHYLLFWAKNKYGVSILVQTLTWNLIANLAYYQYENEEIYIFAKMLFDELPSDYFLVYIEMRKMLGLESFQNQSTPELVLISTLPSLINQLLKNWESKRQYAFIQNIYAIIYQASSNQLPQTFQFQLLAPLVLHAYGSFRKVSFQSSQFVYTQFTKEEKTYPNMTYGSFRQLCEVLLPMWTSQTITEAFYVFSENISKTRIESQQDHIKDNDLDTTDFQSRIMRWTQFQDLFESFQLGRFSIVSSEILDKTANLDLKRLIKNSVLVFNNFKNLLVDIERTFQAHMKSDNGQKIQQYWKKIKALAEVTQCDILVYDFESSVLQMSQAVDYIVKSLLLIKPEGSLVVIGGAINNLKNFFSNQE